MTRGKNSILRHVCMASAVTIFALSGMNPVVAQTSAPASSKSDEKLPSVDKLIEKMVKAVGGEKALRKHSSKTLLGTFEMPGAGLSGDFSSRSAKGNLNVTHVSLPGIGELYQGTTKKMAWSDNPPQAGGVQILEGTRKEQQLIQAIFYPLLEMKKTYKTIEIVGTTEHAGQNCYELTLTTQSDAERTMYVDTESYLIAGTRRTAETPSGDVEFISEITDYKEFDGVMVATNIMTDRGGFQQQIISIDEVSFDAHEKGTFDLPDSIKELMEEKPATSQPSD